MRDASKIVCLRYKGKLELQAGRNLISTEGKNPSFVKNAEGCENCTELRITIPRPSFNLKFCEIC